MSSSWALGRRSPVTVGFAVVGVGDVAQRDYLPEFGRLGDRAALIVACARSEERASTVAERFGFSRWTTDFRAAVTAQDVDAVLNLTPFRLHADVTLAAIAAGKHVYSEKPLAETVARAAAIHEESTRRGIKVVAAPSVLAFPQVRRARQIIAEGRLGPIHSARAHAFGGVPPWEGYMSDPSPFFAEGAGPLVDMAVYPLHAITGLLGPARRVFAMSSRTREAFIEPLSGRRVAIDVDDNWQLVIEVESGVLATIQANNTGAVAAGPEVELQGEQATLGFSLLDMSQPVRIFNLDGCEEEIVPSYRQVGPDHILGVEHLVSCIENDEPPELSVEHAAHVIAILEAARESARTGAACNVASAVGWRGSGTSSERVLIDG
jgi:predicted dehydrogenase